MKNENLFDVSKKIVFITGASRIGQSAATCLAKNGAKVVGIARRKINSNTGVKLVKVKLHII